MHLGSAKCLDSDFIFMPLHFSKIHGLVRTLLLLLVITDLQSLLHLGYVKLTFAEEQRHFFVL